MRVFHCMFRTSSSSRGDLENFSLVLDASDIEDESSKGANMENIGFAFDDKETMVLSPEEQADPVGDNDTPESEVLEVHRAKQRNLDGNGSVLPKVILEQAKNRQFDNKINFML